MKNTARSSTNSATRELAKENAVQTKSDVAHGLRALFVDELKHIYWAENALLKAIPKMVNNATSSELLHALTWYLKATKRHVTRLEEVFSSLGEKAQAKKCEAMEGLIKAAEEIMEHTEEGMVRDAGIILAGQKVEHYEIATYGTLRSFAKTLGERKVTDLLEQTLIEERVADEKLSEIAESFINAQAAGEGRYDDEDDEPNNPHEGSRTKRRVRI